MRTDVSTDLDTACVGKPDVENRHIRMSGPNPGHCIGCCRGFTYYDYVIGPFEQGANSRTDHLVIIEEEYAQTHKIILPNDIRGSKPYLTG